MIRSYVNENHRLICRQDEVKPDPNALWLDLLSPEEDNIRTVEALSGVDLPSREEREEIEVSSRVYTEDGALFMTALLPAQADTDRPIMSPVSFILAGGRIVTIRDHEPRAFETFARRAERTPIGCTTGEEVFVNLLDAVIDRLADVLERVAREIDELSRGIFDEGRAGRRGRTYRPVLQEIGRKGDFTSNIRESLVTLERVVSFVSAHARADPAFKTHRDAVRSLASDIQSLTDHADSLSQKINFLLDATLGLISIAQNGIMATFSVVAVVFLPPTLVASIYGMNFEVMPELSWPWGYPMALGIMLASAVLPYVWFKRKGWL